jgi:hypothetical protein
LVFLLDALDIIAVNVWGIIWSVVLIAIGVWFLSWALGTRRSNETEMVSIPMEDAESVRLRIRHGAGRLSIEGGAGTGEILSGEVQGGIEFRKKSIDGKVFVDIQAPGRIYFMMPFVQRLIWSLKLTERVPVELDIRCGANESNLDLEPLNVTDLRVRTGASDTTLTMPAKVSYTRADVQCGVASVRVNIPEGVAARVRASGGLSNISIDRDRFPRSKGFYQSPGYDDAEYKLDLYLSMGIGSVVLG